MKTRLRSYGPYLVFLAAMLWATDAPFRVHLTQSLTSELIVFLEHAVAFVILLPLMFIYWHEIRRLTLRQWGAVLFIGVGGSALALILFTESFSYMNPSVVILLQKLQPLIAIALAVNFLKEKTRTRFWLWAVLALIGAYVISFPGLVPRLYDGEVFNPQFIGVILALSAAFLWGSATVLGRYMLDTVSFKTMTVLRFSVALVFLLGYNYFNGSLVQISSMTATDWLYIIIISITSGAVAMYIYYHGLAHSRASVATIAELGFPLAAVVVNYVFLDALLTPMQLLGMVVLVVAVLQLGKVNKLESTSN